MVTNHSNYGIEHGNSIAEFTAVTIQHCRSMNFEEAKRQERSFFGTKFDPDPLRREGVLVIIHPDTAVT